ncbi:hypothetical protein LNKW23_21430 [Paralimibaculum aggregatum]|uniref:Transglycosylase SLT domain-containing protein n=1 Tax=Paralimibaculum aggregatum TaxID=3036245 RepID=A0ABQ6LQM5_9RHOB|nr:lytic transglycosylase domain-containing protein [Limibaculum sp. NKW23]GMG82930.1 hypothetical protein LNKW23_21430 [Limibaculum sp. NKW23]
MRAWDKTGFQSVRPPRGGTKRFAPKRKGGSATARRKQHHGWFWEVAEAGQSAASPPRWAEPLDILRSRRARSGALISRARVGRIAEEWGAEIKAAARRHEISEALLVAVIAVESAGNANAVSPKGAVGLMQLIPATAKRFGVRDSRNPGENLSGGAAYLDFLLKKFDGDILLALAGYNAGENAVVRHKGVPPYAETRDYVVLVLDALVAAEPICATPPEGPRRACLFRSVRAPRA